MRAALLLVMVSNVAAAQPARPTAQVTLANVQKFYANANQLTADFKQVVTNNVFGTTTTSEGKLWVEKPSRLRADYYAKKSNALSKTFILDGNIVWYIDHGNKVITKSTTQANSLPAAVSFLTGASTLASQFDVTLGASTATSVILELTPKQPSAQYTQIVFHVDPSDWHVAESMVVYSNETNDITFLAPSTTASVKPSWFVVNPASLPTYQLKP